MIYNFNNESRLVKWDYYQQVYAVDKARGELRLLNKITEEHINPEKINKMRVKSATQFFSHSMACSCYRPFGGQRAFACRMQPVS